jgi:deoxyadenosine/deoxycytidine kinase
VPALKRSAASIGSTADTRPADPAPPVTGRSGADNLYVVACGPLAAGKTSLTQLLSDRLGWQPVFEDLEANPYFADFYLDMSRWAFHVAVSFLAQASQLQPELRFLLRRRAVIQDWYVMEHHNVYNVAMYRAGLIDKRGFETCRRLHETLARDVVAPDLVVHVQASSRTLQARVKSRHRKGESADVPLSYLDGLSSRYGEWLDTLDVPVLVVDTDRLDIVASAHARGAVLNRYMGAVQSVAAARRIDFSGG